MNIKRSVQRQFGNVASRYATSTVFSQGVDLATIEREAATLKPARALDVGTAAGHVAFALAPHAGLVLGLDLTHEMLERAAAESARRGLPNLRVLRGDVDHLPIRPGTLDLLTCRFSGHHFPHPDWFAREAAASLRPGGTLLLADVVSPEDADLDRWMDHVERLRDPSHVRDYTLGEWRDFLAEAGLDPSVLLEWRLTLDFDDWVARQRTPPATVARLRELFLGAPDHHRTAFALSTPDREPWSFQWPCAVLRAKRSR